jgi:ABC-type enterochelin transport system substrate-binding protein
MTNGTVNTVGKSTGKSTTTGTVANEEGTTLTLNYKEGTKKIDVTPETVIVTYLPGSRDELKAGAKIYIPAAARQADGSLMTARVNVGRGVAPPM